MLHIEIKLPTVKIKLEKIDTVNFCKHVLHRFINGDIKSLHDCAAVYAYNKLRTKVNQKTANLSLPLEYAMMLRGYCKTTLVEHDLDRVVLYIIFEQLDKKMK